MHAAEVRRIAVVGAGLMGHGIALEFAVAGYDVRLYDVTAERLAAAEQRIRTHLDLLQRLNLISVEQRTMAPGRIATSADLATVVAPADLVVEAALEDLRLKKQLFADFERYAPHHAILASNSSSYMPSEYGADRARPGQIVGIHYFNPPFLIPLVEIVQGPGTSTATLQTARELLTNLGKIPVLVRREVPGFIGNRLQSALIREALALVADGVAEPQDVDSVIKHSLGRRLAVAGVFEIMDIAGCDLWLTILQNLFPKISAAAAPPEFFRSAVERGELGVKSGRGTYEWTPETAEALREQLARSLAGQVRADRDRMRHNG